MAHNVTSKDIPAKGEKIDQGKLALPKLVALVIFIAGAIGSYLLFTNETWGPGYAYSWLFAFLFFISLALGGCFWTTLHHVTNSGWGVSVRRLMENLGFVFPFMAIIAIPLLVPSVQNNLYEWMGDHRDVAQRYVKEDGTLKKNNGHAAELTKEEQVTEENAHSPYYSPPKKAFKPEHEHKSLLGTKLWYMNLPFWLTRVIGFFVLLGGGIWLLRRISIAQDTDPNPDCKRLIKARKLSCVVMPIFAVVATFIALDFMMALDYKWFSTMYGVYYFAGCALNSMAVLILALTWLRSKGYLHTVTSKEHYHIMGKLMHAFVIFWAYVSFSQFMLIWYANITEETSYFLLRNSNEWWIPSLSLAFVHFAIPFVLLLPHYVKKTVKFVVPICIYLLAVHILDLYIAVIPERGPSLTYMQTGDAKLFVEHKAYLGDIVAFITVGAFFLFMFLRHIGSANLYPNRDPRILESANLHN